MSAPAIFVSHSHKDDEYCHAFVATLRAAGLDVWYDEHNATAGHLRALIERELRVRPIFVVVLTPAALASDWVSDECDWAFDLWRGDKARRVLLPVLAEAVNEDDIWLYMRQFKRIEQAGVRPWPAAEAARRVALAVDPNAPIVAPTPAAPAPSSDELDALLARANALVSQGKRRDAITVLRQATTLASRSVAAWNALGYQLDCVAKSEEDCSQTLEAFERALLLEPNNAFAWAGRANPVSVYYPEQALVCAEKAVALDPTSAFAESGRGLALYKLARIQEALDSINRALVLDPGYLHAWVNKANALTKMERYQDALDAYDSALVLDPDLDTAWSNKGNALLNLGRYQEALDAYDRALTLGQTVIRWQGKADALRKLGRATEAEEAERKAKELEGK